MDDNIQLITNRADDLFKCNNEDFIDCAISDKHIALLTSDGRVCRLVYKIYQKKSKHDNSPRSGEKNKDHKRPRLSADSEETAATRAEVSNALAIQRQTLLANDINPDEALEMRNSITNSTIPYQLRRLRGISRNIIPDNLINRLQQDFPQLSRDVVAIALAQNNLSYDEAVVALARHTTDHNTNSRLYVDQASPRVIDVPPTPSPSSLNYNPLRSFYQRSQNQPLRNANDGNHASTLALNSSNLQSEINLSTDPSTFSSMGGINRPMSFNFNWFSRNREAAANPPAINPRPSPHRLECEVDMCVEVPSTIWWSMEDGVKIKRIFAMRSDLVMLDELGGLHQWNWRKLKPIMNAKNKQLTTWGYHSHKRLAELGVSEERIVHVDASPLRLCFSTETDRVYTFMDRCIPFLSELNHEIPIPHVATSHVMNSIKRISVCNSYAVILMRNGQAFFWGLKTMPMMLPLQFSYLNELKLKDRNKTNSFTVGSKVYNFRCPLHREGSLVADVSNDSIRFGRITSDITQFPHNIVVEVVKDYRDQGSYGFSSKYIKPTKRAHSSAQPQIDIISTHAHENRTTETWRIDSIIFLDDMLDNSYRYELGVVMKVEKTNLIVCTDPELIDKPFKEIAAKAAVFSLSVWKISDTHVCTEKNANEIMSCIKYKTPKESLKINSAVTGHKILAISAGQSNILSIVERSNGEVTGAVFEYKGKNFKEIEFNVPDSIRLGVMNGNFTITHMKHFGDLIVLTTNNGGETVFRRCTNKSRVLDAPALPLISAIRVFSHDKSNSKLNKNLNLCVLLPKHSSIFNNNDMNSISSKYAPEKLLQHTLFYQRQNILHVMAYEALYYGYKNNGVDPIKELDIAKSTRTFIRDPTYQSTIVNYLVSCDIYGFTPIIYAVSIRSYHVAYVYVEFVLDLLLGALKFPNNLTSNTENNEVDQAYSNNNFNELKTILSRAIFPRRTYSPNNSVYYMLCANSVCSFTWSGPKHIKQDIYQCYTCSLSGKLCCCSQCASVCHYGHNCLLMGASPTAYCDCWEISHCKCLLGGDQEMRLRLFKLLVNSVGAFGSSCNERWDILVAFLLYTESRPDYTTVKTDLSSGVKIKDSAVQPLSVSASASTQSRPPNITTNSDIGVTTTGSASSSAISNQNNSASRTNLVIPPIATLTRKDPLSAENISTTDLDRICQRGLVHGFKIQSIVPKFDFIIAALEIIFSNVTLIQKILTPRVLTDDNYGGANLVSEYSQHSTNYQTIEEEIGTSHQQYDVRYVDSTVCYLIFKCKSEPLHKLIDSLKAYNRKPLMNDINNNDHSNITNVFIRAVCRVFNVFITGMSPGLYKNPNIIKYLNTFYNLFEISPSLSVTTLVTMANAIITPVIMNITSCLHNVNLADNENECVEKTVKMFILHPKISKNIAHSDALMSRGNLVEINLDHTSASSEEDSADESSSTSSANEDDELENIQYVGSNRSHTDSSLSFTENDSYDPPIPFVINHDGTDVVDDYSSYSDDETSDDTVNEDQIEYSSSTTNTTDGERGGGNNGGRDDLDDISENSDVSHLFDSEDGPNFGTGFFDTIPRFSQFNPGRNGNSNRSMNVVFNRTQNQQDPSNVANNNNNNSNVDNPSDILQDEARLRSNLNEAENISRLNNINQNNRYENIASQNEASVVTPSHDHYHGNNRLVASLDWSVNNSANRVYGPPYRDLFSRHTPIPEGHPRVISTIFNDSQPTRANITFNTNRNAGGNATNANAGGPILFANRSYPSVLSSNEASARSFASILRTVTIIIKRSDMHNDQNCANVIKSVKRSFEYVTAWLFRVMDYTEALLRHGITTDYRLPKLMKNEMSFLVQNYQQLHDTTNASWNYFRRNSAVALGEFNDEDDYSSNLRVNFLSGILSLCRSSHDEHLYMMPKVDISSMRYVAYIFDAFVYYMKEEKLSAITSFIKSENYDESTIQTSSAVCDPSSSRQNDVRKTLRFFKRTESTLMLASMVPDELTTPLHEALPFAQNPNLLTSTSTKQDLFGFDLKTGRRPTSNLTNQVPLIGGNDSHFKNPYSTNLFQYNEDNISGNLLDWDLVELYARWNCGVTSFAKLFLKDVGVEPGSSLLEIGHYDTKVRSFKRLLNRTMYKTFKEYTIKSMPRDFDEILPITFEKLNTIFRLIKPNGNEKIPRIVATFKNEPGEGQGVTRNFVNDVFLAIISLDKLPDLKNIFLSTRSYLDFSLINDNETFIDSCILRLSNNNARLPNFSVSTSQPFDESNPALSISQKNIGRIILHYLQRKNVYMAQLITGIIVGFPYDYLLKSISSHNVLYNCVREIQVEMEVPLKQRVTKQQLYNNEELKSDDNSALFTEANMKGQYIPLPGKRSRERINAFVNVGRLIGQCIVLDVPCPLVLVRPVVKYLIGRNVSWHDFAFYDGPLYESMRKMIIDADAMENNDEHLYDLFFAVEKMIGGKLEIFDLVPGGHNIIVTPKNVLFYVEKFCLFQMIHSIQLELDAMKRGLNHVIPASLFSHITAEDFKLLVNGCTFVTVEMLKKVTRFVVEASNVPQARIDQFKSWFWSVCNELNQQQRSELLTFWTSSPNLSADYLSAKHSNPVVVIKYLDDFRLPTANTCSTKLFVPLYSTKKILKTQLLAAIKCRTFGFV